jgi:hypothetical protein
MTEADTDILLELARNFTRRRLWIISEIGPQFIAKDVRTCSLHVSRRSMPSGIRPWRRRGNYGRLVCGRPRENGGAQSQGGASSGVEGELPVTPTICHDR